MLPTFFGGTFLALETSGSLGSAAVGSGPRILSRVTLERPGGFSSGLIPAVAQALDEAGVRRADLAGVVVGAGPGSFTGVRVAAATGKGIAHALGIPFWALSSLEAAAFAEEPAASIESERLRYVLFDARDDRVYAACYRRGPAALEERIAPHATRLGEVLANVPSGDVRFVGDGAVRHQAAIEAAGHRVLPAPAGTPTADALLKLLALHPETVPVDGAGLWEPAYLKASNAERARVV